MEVMSVVDLGLFLSLFFFLLSFRLEDLTFLTNTHTHLSENSDNSCRGKMIAQITRTRRNNDGRGQDRSGSVPSFRRSTVVPRQCKVTGMGNEIADKIPAERLRCAKNTRTSYAHGTSVGAPVVYASERRHTRHELGKGAAKHLHQERRNHTIQGQSSLHYCTE